jgi:hypothetical protein
MELKFGHYEQATEFEKKFPPVLTKRLFLLSSVKTSVAFSEKLDFKSGGFL